MEGGGGGWGGGVTALQFKRFGGKMPLFLFIFHIFYTYIHSFNHNSFIRLHSLKPLSKQFNDVQNDASLLAIRLFFYPVWHFLFLVEQVRVYMSWRFWLFCEN